MRYFLDFKSDNYGKKQINEPFGTSGIKFSLKQRTDGGGMARDVSFSGGGLDFEFTDMRDHELEQLLYYNRRFGFESVVELTIEVDKDNKYVCDLDFATAETDDLTYFKCKGIEDGKLQIIKARKKTKVDLLKSTDIDGNYIAPLVPQNMLLLAKPIVQSSKWSSQGNVKFKRSNLVFDVNITNAIDLSGIEDTFAVFPQSGNSNERDLFKIIKAKNNLNNLNLNVKLKGLITGGESKRITLTMIVGKDLATSGLGSTLINATQFNLFTRQVDSGVLDFNIDAFKNIPILERDNSIWLFLRVVQVLAFELETTIQSSTTTIDTQSTGYNSVSKSLRLPDVMAQVVKSISGLEIQAPRFYDENQFGSNRLVNGDFLRGISDKGFSVSLEDLENSFSEFKGDYEIGSNGKVFFGIEQDFYTNIECGFFNNTQFSKMNKTFNPKYSINEFLYKYKNYQSQKENEEVNSADTIHGESRFTLFNKAVENKKNIEIEWTRDAFLIEQTRRKALEIKENTASQDDDTIFAIDSVETTFDNSFTETTLLQHTYEPISGRLILRNDGSINFLSLGIVPESIFYILPTDINAGTYRVFSVNFNTVELVRILNTSSSAGNGSRITRYTYTLDKDFVPVTNYTNQGFSETSGLGSADSYSNRRYSIKRNIINYWNSYLATCNIYWKNNPIRNTWYKNNGDYTAKYNGIKLTEKDDFIPSNPILTPVLYNDIIFKDVDFADFIILQNRIRSERGFVRCIDNNQKVFRVYPVDMEYSLLEKELVIKAEERFEPVSMTISTGFDYVLINNETRVLSLQYEFKNEKLFIYDENRFRLYNGVYWMEVSINGAIAKDIEQLKEWLSLVN
jgi:hypothetical protein